jgi:hypothetical protein
MIEKKSLFFTLLGLACGAALSFWLYRRFKITGFFLFIPFFSLGGPLFRRFGGGEKKKEIEHTGYTVEEDDE